MTEQPKTVEFTGYVEKQDTGDYVLVIPNPDQEEFVRKKMIDVPVYVKVIELDENTTLFKKAK